MAISPYKQWLAFAITGLLWGSSFLWIKIALEEIGPFTVVVGRLVFGIIGLLSVMLYTRQRFPRDPKIIRNLAIMSFLNPGIPFMLISWAEMRIDSGVASILNGTVPLFTILIAHVFLHDEKITPSRLFGLLVGFLGVVVLVGRGVNDFTGQSAGAMGAVAVVIASFVYGSSGVYSRRNLKNLSPVVQATSVMLFAEIWALIALPLMETNFVFPHQMMTWIALVWLGLLGTCTAFLCYFYLLNSWGATRASLVNYLFPVIGLVLGIVFRHEPVDLNLICGSLLVVSSILIVSFKSITSWKR